MLHAVGYIAVLQDRWQGAIPVINERVSGCPMGRLPFAHHPGEFEILVQRLPKEATTIFEAMVLDIVNVFQSSPLGMARGVWFFEEHKAAIWQNGEMLRFGLAAEWTI